MRDQQKEKGVTRLARVGHTLKVFTVPDYRYLLQSKGKEAALMMGDQPSPVSNLSDKSAWRADSRLSVCFTRNNRVTPYRDPWVLWVANSFIFIKILIKFLLLFTCTLICNKDPI